MRSCTPGRLFVEIITDDCNSGLILLTNVKSRLPNFSKKYHLSKVKLMTQFSTAPFRKSDLNYGNYS